MPNDNFAPPVIEGFFDPETYTVSYVVSDPDNGKCAIIDPVLDFDMSAGRTATRSADRVIDYVKSHDLEVEWILETHAHADHLSAAPYLRQKLGGKLAIGEHIPDIQAVFSRVFNLDASLKRDGSQFDKLLKDGEFIKIGHIPVRVIYTPGHTAACVSYHIGDAIFVGDTLFMPDYGSARCDFPGGDAGILYDSVQKLYQLPDATRMFLCHDYLAPGRNSYVWETTVGAQKARNIHLNAKTTKDEFVALRNARDAKLDMPKLIIPAIQVNIRAGEMPEAEDNGQTYLKIPINNL